MKYIAAIATVLHLVHVSIEFRVGTASSIYFSSSFTSSKLTTSLQLHVGLQYPGQIGQIGETPLGGIGDHLAFESFPN